MIDSARKQKAVLLGGAFLVLIAVIALLYRPYLEHRWMLWRLGMTHDEYRQSLQFPEAIELEVGITVDGEYVNREPMILITPDAMVYPTWDVTRIDRSDVSELDWTLDGAPIDPDQPITAFVPRAKVYVLSAEGRSARHKARFSNSVGFWVVHDLPDELLTRPNQKMLVTDDAVATRILLGERN